MGGKECHCFVGLFLRSTASLVTTVPIQKPHTWWGGRSPGTQGMTNPSWPSTPTFSVLQTSLLSGPNRWSSLHHSLPGCQRSGWKLQKHLAVKESGSRSHWPISTKMALQKCLSQGLTANDQLFFLLSGGQNYLSESLSHTYTHTHNQKAFKSELASFSSHLRARLRI